MFVLGLIGGCFLGFLTACYGVYRLIIGTLKIAHDDQDGESYLYVELDKPYIPKHKYVVMRTDRSPK